MNSPRTPRSLNRSQRGQTRPTSEVDVKSGSARIDQLSTPRFRVTGNDWQEQSASFGSYSSPRLSQDQKTVFTSTQKMITRVQNQHRFPSVSPRRNNNNSNNSATTNSGRGANFVPEIPSATKLLKSFQNEHQHDKDQNSQHRVPLFPSVNHHDGAGIAGIILSDSIYLEDQAAKFGTKNQKHELCNTQVPLAMKEPSNYPVYVPTSGRRAMMNSNNDDGDNISPRTSARMKIVAPEPSAVRSLAISGIDTSRVEDRPQAPQYFQSALSPDQNPRPTRNGSNKNIKYPNTLWMSQAERNSGQFIDSAGQFNPNDRGLHNASSYILEDKLKKKATDEIRISKCGWNEDAVAARAQAEIDFKKSRTDKRVAVKRQMRLDYEERVGAGL